jgi:hypothetical protein
VLNLKIPPLDLSSLKKTEFETQAEFASRMAIWTANYSDLVKLGSYDTESESFNIEIENVKINFQVPWVKAKKIKIVC